MKYGKHSSNKKFLSSPFTLIGLLILAIILVRAVWGVSDKARIGADKLAQAENELAKLQTYEKELSQKVDYISTEKGIEAEFRTKYHAVKEGESVAVIVDRNQQSNSVVLSESDQKQLAAAFEASSTPRLSWWHKLLQKFGL